VGKSGIKRYIRWSFAALAAVLVTAVVWIKLFSLDGRVSRAMEVLTAEYSFELTKEELVPRTDGGTRVTTTYSRSELSEEEAERVVSVLASHLPDLEHETIPNSLTAPDPNAASPAGSLAHRFRSKQSEGEWPVFITLKRDEFNGETNQRLATLVIVRLNKPLFWPWY